MSSRYIVGFGDKRVVDVEEGNMRVTLKPNQQEEPFQVNCDMMSVFPFRKYIYYGVKREMIATGAYYSFWADYMIRWLNVNLNQNVVSTIKQRPIRSGVELVAWGARMKQAPLQRMVDKAFSSMTREQWQSQCVAAGIRSTSVEEFVMGRKRGRLGQLLEFVCGQNACPYEQDLAVPVGNTYCLESDKSLLVAMSISLTQDGSRFLRRSIAAPSVYVPLLNHTLPMMSVEPVKMPAHVEIMATMSVDRFVSQVVPNVSQMSVCALSQSRDLLDTPWLEELKGPLRTESPIESVVRIEEYIYGVPLGQLVTEPVYKPLMKRMNISDWQSIVWQIVMTHYAMIESVGLIHFDTHMDSLIVSFQEKPCCIGYSIEGPMVTTKRSQVLCVRTDWTKAVATAMYDPYAARFLLCQSATQWGRQSRHLLTTAAKSSRAPVQFFIMDNVPMYACPMMSDWLDSLVLLYSVVERDSQLCFTMQNCRDPLLKMLTTMIGDIVVEMGKLIDPSVGSAREAKVLIDNMCVLEGGLLLPDKWFEMDKGLLLRMIVRWQIRVGGLSIEEPDYVSPMRQWPKVACDTINQVMESLSAIPVVTFPGLQVEVREQVIQLKGVFLEMIESKPSYYDRYMRKIKSIVDRAAEKPDVISKMMWILERQVDKVEPHFGIAMFREKDQNLTQAQYSKGLSFVKLAQLANAACRVLGQEYLFYTIQADEIVQVQRGIVPELEYPWEQEERRASAWAKSHSE